MCTIYPLEPFCLLAMVSDEDGDPVPAKTIRWDPGTGVVLRAIPQLVPVVEGAKCIVPHSDASLQVTCIRGSANVMEEST